ncbi:MAG TPA: hypothetical protein VFJ80_09770 [Candidatus Limnocylindrales bacterium]|nr:hypothetical protein [Candidatus Limnocylindrales bacterium]
MKGPLPAGRYTTSQLVPRLTFTLGDGWRGYFDDSEGAYMGKVFGFNSGEMVMGRPPEVVDPTTKQAEPVPDDLLAWIASHPAFRSAGEPKPVTIAGRPGNELEASAVAVSDVFYSPQGNFHTIAGHCYRFTVLTMEGPDLTITSAGTPDAFAAMRPEVDQIFSSLEVGP